MFDSVLVAAHLGNGLRLVADRNRDRRPGLGRGDEPARQHISNTHLWRLRSIIRLFLLEDSRDN